MLCLRSVKPRVVYREFLEPVCSFVQSRKFSIHHEDSKPTEEHTSKKNLVPLTTTDSSSVSIDDERLEKFIPVTRRTLLRVLLEDKGLFSSKQKKHMETVAAALDAKYSKRFYSVLEQAKVGENEGDM